MNNKKINIILYFVLVIAAIYFNVWCWFGVDSFDSFYWINQFIDCKLSSPMVNGMILIGHWYTELFGANLISYRIGAYIISVVTCILPYIVLLDKYERKNNLFYFVFGFISFLSLTPGFLFHIDLFSKLFFCILACLLSLFYKKNNCFYVLCMGIISILMVIIRFPNILVVPFVVILLFIITIYINSNTNKSTNIKNCLIYESLYVGLLCVGILLYSFLMNGNLWGYALSIINDLHHPTMGGHSIDMLFWCMFRDFDSVLVYFGILVLMFFTYKISIQYDKKRQYVILTGALLFFIFMLYRDITYTFYNWQVNLFLVSYVCFILLYQLYYHKFGIVEFVLLGCAVLSFLGSDTGLYKFAPILLCFLPIITSNIENSIKFNKFALVVSVIVLLFVLFNYTKGFDEDRIYKMTATIEGVPGLEGIRTTPKRCDWVKTIYNKCDSILNETDNVFIYGNKCHIFRYSTKRNPRFTTTMMMSLNNEQEINNVIKPYVYKETPVVVCVFAYPAKNIEVYNENKNELTSSYFHSCMIQNNYQVSIYDGYAIYTPNYDIVCQ